MAQLKEGSIIKKSTGDEVIATLNDIPASLPADGGNSDTVGGFTVGVNVPSDAKFTDTVYTHPTTAGNKHIPAGGATNQYLKYSASGTAVWSDLGDAPSVNGKSIWVGAEGSKGTDSNTIYFCY